MSSERWRSRTRSALQAYFRRRSFPRLTLSVILLITGVCGFLISYLLLHLGMVHMWARYPLAVLLSYALLLALIRLWVEIERSRFDPAVADIENAEEYGEPNFQSLPPERSWWSYFDLPADVFTTDEGCLIFIFAMIFFALLGLLLTTLAAAPALIAEVFLDAFLISALFRRLRVAQKEHWLGAALRKTLASALVVALLLGLGGWILEVMAPGAHSIGKAIEQIRAHEL